MAGLNWVIKITIEIKNIFTLILLETYLSYFFMPRRVLSDEERYRRAMNTVNTILEEHDINYIILQRKEYENK